MKKLTIWTIALILLLSAVIPALAANVFLFTERSVSLFEGESVQTVLRREGVYDGDGNVVYTSSKPKIARVSADGLVEALSKGQTVVSAELRRNGKTVGKTQITVNVLRAVTKVTLNTTQLAVYRSDDPKIAGLLLNEPEEPATEETETEQSPGNGPANRDSEPGGEENSEYRVPVYQVLVIAAGSSATLKATCTPEDASSKAVTFTSTDAGVARVAGTTLKAMQAGECELITASVQNPEITETMHVLVVQPVKKIEINAGSKKVAAGSTLQLTAACLPENASIREVTWASRNPAIAEVDENGLVRGVKRGNVSIVATAADGSRVTAVVALTVTQPVKSISFATRDITVVAGRYTQAKVTILPADASDKAVTWTSSDESVATVRNGQVTGKRAGTCTITCTSNSNPEISATLQVRVTQLVTRIENVNAAADLNLKVGEWTELMWNVLPLDATDKGLTFRSAQPKIATVDEDGVVRALSRGTATIIATARDGSQKQGTVKVNVIQPVTGITMRQPKYYVQRGWNAAIKAIVEPKNANNQKVIWTSENERIATVRSSGTITGTVHGVSDGYVTITGRTEDGGYTATTEIRVGDFNGVVLIEALSVDADNNIRITLRNMSQDIILSNVHFKVECYDLELNPMTCNKDGESTFFEGDYPFELMPLERTVHGAFRFKNYVIDEELGMVELTVMSWRDADDITWVIPESERLTLQWVRNTYTLVEEEAEG